MYQTLAFNTITIMMMHLTDHLSPIKQPIDKARCDAEQTGQKLIEKNHRIATHRQSHEQLHKNCESEQIIIPV